MKKTTVLILAFVVALTALSSLALAGSREAQTASVGREVGGFPRASCPGDSCRVLTRTSGYNRAALGTRAPDTVPFTGKITSFRVRLGKPTAKQQAFFNKRFGSPAKVAITILRLVKTREHFVYKAEHVSEIYDVHGQFGQAIDFGLGSRALPAKRGDVIAITTPTWAPVLAVGLDSSNSWRSSRRPHAGAGVDHGRGCSNLDQRTYHTSPGTIKQYLCQYSTAALLYSATLNS
jgi:hypothetical protein